MMFKHSLAVAALIALQAHATNQVSFNSKREVGIVNANVEEVFTGTRPVSFSSKNAAMISNYDGIQSLTSNYDISFRSNRVRGSFLGGEDHIFEADHGKSQISFRSKDTEHVYVTEQPGVQRLTTLSHAQEEEDRAVMVAAVTTFFVAWFVALFLGLCIGCSCMNPQSRCFMCCGSPKAFICVMAFLTCGCCRERPQEGGAQTERVPQVELATPKTSKVEKFDTEHLDTERGEDDMESGKKFTIQKGDARA